MTQDERRRSESDLHRTILRPAPGKRGISAQTNPTPTSLTDGRQRKARPKLPESQDRNVLLGAANRVLALAVQLRRLHLPPEMDRLGEETTLLVREFESNALKRGASQDLAIAARYCLCTFLDESISTTPWGGGGQWDGKRLLVQFHSEAFGGEKFFVLLNRARERPHETIDLLELMHVILALGFLGRYASRSKTELADVREELFHTIQVTRGAPPRELSPRWRPATVGRPAMARWIPLWVVLVACAAALFGAYVLFAALLGNSVDTVTARIDAVEARPPVSSLAAPPATQQPAMPRALLSELLGPEQAAGLVEVYDGPDRSTVSIPGDGLFDSGKAAVRARYVGIIERIAKALNAVPGDIEISGHTDNVGSDKSNRLLSKARADAVWTLMLPHLDDSSRLSAKGFGADLPRESNDSPQHRAMNRRVEIALVTRSSVRPAQN